MQTPRIRPLARRLVASTLLGAALAATGCGGAARKPQAPTTAPTETAPADPARLPILLEPPAPPSLAPFAVNPTVAVSARPGLRVAPVADGAAFAEARRALERGALPDARPEAFVDAVADDPPGPALRATWAPSPYRPGYHGLRIAIAPPPAAPPPATVIVLEARRDLLDADERAALRALAIEGRAVGLLVAGERPRWALWPGPGGGWAAAVDDLTLAGPADLAAGIAAARAALPADGTIIAVARSAATGALRVAPGPDFGPRLRGALDRRPWLAEAALAIDFDARHVERYRLVGFDGGGRGGAAPTLWSGRPTAVLVEIRLRRDRPAGAIGVARLRGAGPDGRPAAHTLALAPAEGGPRVRRALLAAAVAEKLRAAWWSRVSSWDRLAADARALAPDPAAAPLLDCIERAAAIDRRPDRFAGHGPVGAMDPDVVPILGGPR